MEEQFRLDHAPDRWIDCLGEYSDLHRQYLRRLQGHDYRHQKVHKVRVAVRPDPDVSSLGPRSVRIHFRSQQRSLLIGFQWKQSQDAPVMLHPGESHRPDLLALRLPIPGLLKRRRNPRLAGEVRQEPPILRGERCPVIRQGAIRPTAVIFIGSVISYPMGSYHPHPVIQATLARYNNNNIKSTAFLDEYLNQQQVVPCG